jgi:hypothetical protein
MGEGRHPAFIGVEMDETAGRALAGVNGAKILLVDGTTGL